MNISYIASSGHIYPLTAASIKIKDAKFHTWEFKPEGTELLNGFRVSQMRKQAATYQVKLVVRGNPVARAATLNALHDDFENDNRNLKTGRVIWGDWYADGYVVASETVPYDDVTHWTENAIDFYVPSGFWAREEERHFDVPVPPVYEYLDYTYDYEYDYAPPIVADTIWDPDSPFDSDFEMRIYGPCINPKVTINGYSYLVNVSVPEGGVLVINSKKQTVMMGNQNCFDLRNKVNSVFQKIPTGALSIIYGEFAFDLILYEERSEPKW